ncbi:hypothetical protein [Microcoleus sp. OTE_8_concoct_300]|uniref:hypothetical protein n=1 Tax=Microcoleus sp. OTE_8_concoct_300 TaxID=2964710 RepID=UPI00403F0534
MRKMLVALLLVLALTLSLGQEKALADCSNETINTGAATVVTQLYESQCAILGWSSGVITKDMTANCCGPSVVIRINGNDWNQLVQQGKLDGLRYIRVSKSNEGAYQIEPRKVTTGGKPVTISGADFFK